MKKENFSFIKGGKGLLNEETSPLEKNITTTKFVSQ
jgi:hypothetical protein